MASGPIVQAQSFSVLKVLMDEARAAGHTDVIGELYSLLGIAPGSLIGRWRWNGTGYEPIGPVELSRVTDSHFGVQDAASVTTGTTRTLASGHNITETSGTATFWDVSAGAALGEALEWTRSGDVITFTGGDPGTSATGDLFVIDGRCEFGPLSDTGYWLPTAGTTAYWLAAGLYVQGTGDWSGVLLKIASIAGPPRNITINARWNVTDSAAGDGSAYGLGASDGVTAYGGCNKNSTGTWGRHGFWGTIGSTFGLGSSASSTGSPNGLTGIHTLFQAADNVGAGTVRWSQHVQHASLTPSFGAGIGNSLYSLLSYDSNVSALLFLCKTITSGALSAVATECRFTAEEA